YLYLYPAFHLCHFPESKQPRHCTTSPTAPFRLLIFADPQLEGDSSLPDPNEFRFPHLRTAKSELGNILYGLDVDYNVVWSESQAFIRDDVPKTIHGYRKHIDLFGNDYYLAHIYRTLHWWTEPTHTTVLGDLVGSQWVGDEEFQKRSDRYWNRVFRGANQINKSLMQSFHTIFDLNNSNGEFGSWNWNRQLINIVGNHDVGYSGDMDSDRVTRYEERFGPVNGMLSFAMPCLDPQCKSEPYVLRLVVLNSMNLDGPTLDNDLASDTQSFIGQVETELGKHNDTRQAVVLLTHIPLYKPEGICTDGPFFDYFPSDQGGGVMEQNHLSKERSLDVLNQIFEFHQGHKRDGIILTGHDHTGCDTFHSSNGSDDDLWDVTIHEKVHNPQNSIREITVRSMMGEYGGNAGLLSVWTDCEGVWNFGYSSCPLGVQHIWWAIHGFVLVSVLACLI
ncbi:hypothetical protein P152DRAFT_369794, partial [Eremomyces bilateralis CBS 781.70]